MRTINMCSTDLVIGDKFTNTEGSYLIISYGSEDVSIQKNPAINNSDISKVKTYYSDARRTIKQDQNGLWVGEYTPKFSKVSKDGTVEEWKKMVIDFIKNIGIRYKSMKLNMSDSYMIFLNKEDWKKFKAKNYNQIFLKKIVESNPSEKIVENEVSSKAKEMSYRASRRAMIYRINSIRSGNN